MANKFSKNDEAVSAVIGVILMVAITVILAAVIAAFVFGMGNNVKKTYTVAITATRADANTVSLTNNGGNDINKIKYFNVIVDGSTPNYYTSPTATTGYITSAFATTVGSSINLAATSPGTAGNHVVVAGVFADGTNQVLLDTYV